MKLSGKPAALSGKSAFKTLIPIVRPPLTKIIDKTLQDYRNILDSRMITNFKFVQRLETATANYLGVEHCVAIANCTSALMLALKSLDIKDGEALMPSFTFPATAHAVHWNNLRIKLVDCDPRTFNISVEDLQQEVTKKSKVIVPVHVFGNPCDTQAINEIAEDNDLKVVYDAAHAFGAKLGDVPIGRFGDAEVFSGSPTKAFTTVEGGIVATDSEEITDEIKIGRNYGHRGNYNCEMPGLSARMSELHAALGLNLLPHVASDVAKRNRVAQKYIKGLSKLPGIRFQEITPHSLSTYKDFAVLVDEEQFGLNRDQLAVALDKENIMTRKYFYPPIHMQQCYPELHTVSKNLPNTNLVSERVLCLPMFSELLSEQIEGVVAAISRIQKHAKEMRVAPQ